MTHRDKAKKRSDIAIRGQRSFGIDAQISIFHPVAMPVSDARSQDELNQVESTISFFLMSACRENTRSPRLSVQVTTQSHGTVAAQLLLLSRLFMLPLLSGMAANPSPGHRHQQPSLNCSLTNNSANQAKMPASESACACSSCHNVTPLNETVFCETDDRASSVLHQSSTLTSCKDDAPPP